MEENNIQQQYSDTCAIKSQQLILEDFGVNISEYDLVKYSIDNGWYSNDGSGTAMGDIGRLLDAASIPCTSRLDANIFDLANELQQGHKVIVGVDSGELWKEDSLLRTFQEWLEDFFGKDVPDHALIVAGIDVSDPTNPLVLVTDPGTGEKERAYPMGEFMDAWKDSQCFMCSTNVAPQDVAEQFQQNAESTGDETWNNMQMPEIPGVDKQAFQQCVDYSHAIQNNEDLRAQMPSLYEWFDNHQLTWEQFRPYDLLPYFTQMNALALSSPMVFPEPPILPPPPIMPCDFNYNMVMDTNWMCQPYTPMCFPPVQPMPLNPVFQPVCPTWSTAYMQQTTTNDSQTTTVEDTTTNSVKTLEDSTYDSEEMTEETTTDSEETTEETYENLKTELDETDIAVNKTNNPGGATGFPDIDVDFDEDDELS